VMEHWSDQGEPLLSLGSLGESLHHLRIAEERGVDPSMVWNEPLVVLTTADRAVEDRMRSLLVDAGFDERVIHTDRITTEVVTMGMSAETDTFSVVWRPALATDGPASQAFYDDPGATVLRVTPETQRTLLEPHPRPAFKEPGSGTDESAWGAALDELEAAIEGAYADLARAEAPVVDVYQDTLDCIPLVRCGADIRDRFVRMSPVFDLEGDEFLMVFGVNHARTGKASYSNLSVVEREHLIGVVDLNSQEMVGSARHWLPDHPLADDLYAASIRRDCTGRAETCLEVPVGCPGVETGGEMHLTLRAYLEPATGVAPAAAELATDHMVKYWPTASRR